jgi:hypothetical protein
MQAGHHMHRHTKRKLALKSLFIERFSRMINLLGDCSHEELAQIIHRDRSTIEAWLNPGEPAVPDWADLYELQSLADRKGVAAEFFRLVGTRRQYRLRMVIPARSGMLAAVLVQIFHDGGDLVSLAAGLDETEQKAIVTLSALLPGGPERVVDDLRSLVDSIEVLNDL